MEEPQSSQNTLEFLVEEQTCVLNLNNSKDRYERQAAASELGKIVDWIIESKDKTAFFELLKAVESLIYAMRNDYMKPVRDRAREVGGTIYYRLMIKYHVGEGLDSKLTNVLKKLRRALILAGADLTQEKKEELTETDPANLIKTINTSEDIDMREAAIEKLGNLQAQEAIALLVDLLRDAAENPDIRAAGVVALAKITTPELNNYELNKYNDIINALIQALNYSEPIENDSFVRLQAAIALGKLIPSKAIDALEQAIKQDKFSNVRDAAKDALKNYIRVHKTSSKDKIRVFRYLELAYPEDTKQLSKENFPDSKLIKELSSVRNVNFDRMTVNELIQSLKDEINTDECVTIAKILGKMGDPRALKPLIEKLKVLEHDWIARKYVIQAFGELNIPSILLDETQLVKNILVERLRNDIISDVRDAVEKTLLNIYIKNDYKDAEEALRKYSSDPFILMNQIGQTTHDSSNYFIVEADTDASKKLNPVEQKEDSDSLAQTEEDINQCQNKDFNQENIYPKNKAFKPDKNLDFKVKLLLIFICLLLSILISFIGLYAIGNKNLLIWLFIIFLLGSNIFLGLLLVFLLGIIIGNDKIREIFKQIYQ
ncbi:HEAT repeat domain-containing protein [Mastigocoleus testarum]|uniref:PBS lyase n=1 Tax=Mastigocoleus testarum BC008 TaxID=371196 RepID=A0A0V7ZKD5_9CYAN|nr:HEAT repeat domain-containing protein [Mastigocoleus testarum]KST65061.1 hypothetical protein BC008_19870 [Mastigocoleus testarum BC008]